MSDRLLLLRKKDKPLVDMSFLGSMPNAVTFTRPSSGWRFNASGQLVEETTNAPRFDYDPLTLACKGLLMEEQRTNSLTNSVLAGAVPGSPGTLPTNFVSLVQQGGITRSVVATGTDANGMTYVDIRHVGTASNTTSSILWMNSNGEVAAVKDDVWTSSFYAKIVSGDLTNVSACTISSQEYNGSTALGTRSDTTSLLSSLNSAFQRFQKTYTLTDATATQLRWGFRIVATIGAAIDVTVRFYLPQQEKGAGATSPILTNGAAATRAAEACYTASIPWYNATKGSFASEFILETPAVTAITRATAHFSDGTNNNRLMIFTSTTGKSSGMISVSGTAKYTGSSNTLVAETTLKHAMSYIENNTRAAADGLLLSLNEMGACAVPSAITKLNIGTNYAPAYHLNGWIRRFRYWNYPLDTTAIAKVTI